MDKKKMNKEDQIKLAELIKGPESETERDDLE